jgi:NADH-quinone oxidoreductase subunit N
MTTLPYLDLLPLFLLAGGVALVLVAGLFSPTRAAVGWIAVLVLLGAGVALALLPTLGEDAGRTLAARDAHYPAFATMALLGGLFAALTALSYVRRREPFRTEFFALLLISTLGGVALASARDLLYLFVALEVLTLPLFVLAGYYRSEAAGVESSLKYFFIGVLSSAFLLYGIALLFGATGTLRLEEIGMALGRSPELAASPLVLVSLGLMLVGVGFKVAAVPFHFWAPDVYQGAPTPVTAFLAIASKAGGFLVALRVLLLACAALSELWVGLVSLLAAATLVVGALLALLQEDVKRLLAYSSVAHAGFLLVAVAAQGRMAGPLEGGVLGVGSRALVFYLLAYSVTAGGAFAVVTWYEDRYGGPVRIADYEGLARRHPVMAGFLTFCLLSLAGIPPTGGFVAKLLLLRAAVEARLWALALVAVLTAVVGMFYYLRLVVAMYFRPAREGEPPERRLSLPLALAVAASAAGILFLGVWPGPVLALLEGAPLP